MKKQATKKYQHAQTLFEGCMQFAETDFYEMLSQAPEDFLGGFELSPVDLSAALAWFETTKYAAQEHYREVLAQAFDLAEEEIAAEVKIHIASFKQAYQKACQQYLEQLNLFDDYVGEGPDPYDMLTSDSGIIDFCLSDAGLGTGVNDGDPPWSELKTMGVDFKTLQKLVHVELPHTEPLFVSCQMLSDLVVPHFVQLVKQDSVKTTPYVTHAKKVATMNRKLRGSAKAKKIKIQTKKIWPVYTNEAQKELEQVEMVFGLTGGELADGSWGGHGYWYEGAPDWALDDFKKYYENTFRTTVTFGGGYLPYPSKEIVDPDGTVWTLVKTYTNSGETSCPVCGDGTDTFEEEFTEQYGHAPGPEDECGLCENKVKDMPGYISIGEGYEAVYLQQVVPEQDEVEEPEDRFASYKRRLFQNKMSAIKMVARKIRAGRWGHTASRRRIADFAADGEFEETESFFKELVKRLARRGVEATYRFFDKYQGYYLNVSGVDKFWITHYGTSGQMAKQDAAKPYGRAVLVDLNTGEESSADRGDYFNAPKDYVFKDTVLELTKSNGEKVEIENPKLSDLPDGSAVRTTFQYEKGTKVKGVYELTGEHSEATFEITVDHATGRILDATEFLSYCKGAPARRTSNTRLTYKRSRRHQKGVVKRKQAETTLVWEKNGPGKFSDNIDEWVYEAVIEGGGTEELGDVETFGHYDLLVLDEPVTVQDVGLTWTFIAAILHEDNQGFIDGEYYETEAEARAAWAELEANEGKFMEDVDEDRV